MHALYVLCSIPQVVEDLRKELVDALAFEGGWSLQALRRTMKLDSFLAESVRINPASLRKLWTFEDWKHCGYFPTHW
jgi:hypothetical protein